MIKLWRKLSDEDRIVVSLFILIAIVASLLTWPSYVKASAELTPWGTTSSQVTCRLKGDRL